MDDNYILETATEIGDNQSIYLYQDNQKDLTFSIPKISTIHRFEIKGNVNEALKEMIKAIDKSMMILKKAKTEINKELYKTQQKSLF